VQTLLGEIATLRDDIEAANRLDTRRAATIATLRAALDGLVEALKEAAHVHHVTTHSSIAAFADCDQPFCQRVRAALATAKEADHATD